MTPNKKVSKRKGRWKKGESGNPKGKPPLPPEVREVRRMTTEEIIMLGTEMFDKTVNELKTIMNDKNLPSKRVAIASVIYWSITDGDMKNIDSLLNRIIGKVRDVLELKGHVGIGIGKYDGLTLEQIQKKRADYQTERDIILNAKSTRKADSQKKTDGEGAAEKT